MDEKKITDIDRTIGRNLRIYRNRRGMSRDDLGRRLGVTGQRLYQIENGKGRLPASQAYLAAQHLRVPLGDLFLPTPDR